MACWKSSHQDWLQPKFGRSVQKSLGCSTSFALPAQRTDYIIRPGNRRDICQRIFD